MSQARVTDFFSTRKRGRQDDLLLGKEKRIKSKKAEEVEIVKSVVVTVNNTQVEQAVVDVVKLNDTTNTGTNDVAPRRSTRSTTTTTQTTTITTTGKEKLTAEELKQRIQNFNKKLQKHKEKYATPVIVEKNENETNNISKIQEKIKQITENVCSSSEASETIDNNTPAYEKYSHLASDEYEKRLILPVKYMNLLELFKGSDTTIKFMNNRQEICTFLKLKKAVENMTKKNFTQTNLGQIKTVYPTAYIFKQEKLYIDYKNDYHLTIEANIERDLTPNENGVKIITPIILLERLQRFKNCLFDIVKTMHQKFLKSIGVSVNAKEIKRWHPKFDLESVNDIECSELPQRPNDIKVKTGEDLVNIAKEVYSNRVKNAINTILQQQQKEQKESVNDKQQQTDVKSKDENVDTTTTTTKKSVEQLLKEKQKTNYNALLERIRAKEREKDLEKMVINSDKEKRLQMLEKYTDCVRCIKSYFQSEKKATIDIEQVCLKMHESLRVHTIQECEVIVKELCNDFKQWISIIKVRNVTYVKLDKTIDLNLLIKQINDFIEQVKASN